MSLIRWINWKIYCDIAWSISRIYERTIWKWYASCYWIALYVFDAMCAIELFSSFNSSETSFIQSIHIKQIYRLRCKTIIMAYRIRSSFVYVCSRQRYLVHGNNHDDDNNNNNNYIYHANWNPLENVKITSEMKFVCNVCSDCCSSLIASSRTSYPLKWKFVSRLTFCQCIQFIHNKKKYPLCPYALHSIHIFTIILHVG